jgi:hypothetical protein
MSEAARLRAQKAYSTDPEYLERMALAVEACAVRTSGKNAGSPLAPEVHQDRMPVGAGTDETNQGDYDNA